MKIMFVGDMNLGEYYTSFGHGPGTFAKGNDIFSQVREIFDQADYVVGNLEASITNENNGELSPPKAVLKVDPLVAFQFKQAGFRVLQVANNHTIQHGRDAFEQSLDILDSMDIMAVGIDKQKVQIVNHGGISVGFLAASDVPDNTDKEQNLYQRNDGNFLKIVEESVSLVDHLVVMLHWGLESSTIPLQYQRDFSAKLNALGVSAVIGSHPHLFYEIEVRDDFVCAYSLGNFVFDLCWDNRLMKTGILEIDFHQEKSTVTVWPVRIKGNSGQPAPNGPPIKIRSSYSLYDHGVSLNWQQTKKTLHLLANIFKGNTRLKFIFLKNKIFHKGSPG